MAASNEQALWTSATWLEEVHAWIQSSLNGQGHQLTGSLEEPLIRPWSAMIRVPTTNGICYFKATAAAFSHEPALTQALARWYPADIVPLVAVEPARGWLLMDDSSPTLRSLLQEELTLSHWRQIFLRYAKIQLELSQRQAELLALGVPDRRLAQLPAQYAALLNDLAMLRIEQSEGLTTEEYEQLCTLKPDFADLCARLAAYGIPETLHHDDFHDANIFVRAGRYRLTDWAESCVSHPFFTLVVGLRGIAYRFDLANDSPELAQLRALYLDAWRPYGDLPTLLAASQLAECIGTVCRALTWHSAMVDLSEPLKTEYGEAVPRWLKQFLNAQTAL